MSGRGVSSGKLKQAFFAGWENRCLRSGDSTLGTSRERREAFLSDVVVIGLDTYSAAFQAGIRAAERAIARRSDEKK